MDYAITSPDLLDYTHFTGRFSDRVRIVSLQETVPTRSTTGHGLVTSLVSWFLGSPYTEDTEDSQSVVPESRKVLSFFSRVD